MQPWFDDMVPGYTVTSQPHLVNAEEIVAFGQLWDPQPFHTDAVAARDSAFGQLVASGTHMHALMMRLGYDANVLRGKSEIGLGVDEMRFLQPLTPGTTITARFTVLSLRASASRPTHGIVRWHAQLLDEDDVVLFSAVAAVLHRRRP
jgi:acyl dehydratase